LSCQGKTGERVVARKKPPKDEPNADLGAAVRRLTNVAALLLVKGEAQPEKIRALAAAGYSNAEIAEMLHLKPNTVAVALHRIRKK
jgi:DNA-binding NarL/FixJ family response regulator